MRTVEKRRNSAVFSSDITFHLGAMHKLYISMELSTVRIWILFYLHKAKQTVTLKSLCSNAS